VPWFSISSWFQPPPTPNRNRPWLTWSIEATSLAVWIASRCCTRWTISGRRSCEGEELLRQPRPLPGGALRRFDMAARPHIGSRPGFKKIEVASNHRQQVVEVVGILKSEVIEFSASGFRDFTRIVASDLVMWRDIFLNNREAVLEIVERFTEDLTALQRAIRWGEGDKLRSSLPAPARSVVRSSRRSRPERARRTYSQVIRGTLPSFAGPRNICPFWIVNAVLISGLPSGPALASNVSAMRASPASVARICPFCTSAVRIWSYPWTLRRSRRSAGAPGRGRSSPSPSH